MNNALNGRLGFAGIKQRDIDGVLTVTSELWPYRNSGSFPAISSSVVLPVGKLCPLESCKMRGT